MPERQCIRPGQERPGSRRTPLVVTDFGVIYDDDWSAGIDGRTRRIVGDVPVEEMSTPVVCSFCGAIYDTGHVTVTARYADCDMWKSPCCNKTADSRRAWHGGPEQHMGYRELRR